MTTYPHNAYSARIKPHVQPTEDFRVTPWILLSVLFGLASAYTATSMAWTAADWNAFVVNVTALVATFSAAVGVIIAAVYKIKSIVKGEGEKTREVVAKIETANPLDTTAFPTTDAQLKAVIAAAVAEALKQQQANDKPRVQT